MDVHEVCVRPRMIRIRRRLEWIREVSVDPGETSVMMSRMGIWGGTHGDTHAVDHRLSSRERPVMTATDQRCPEAVFSRPLTSSATAMGRRAQEQWHSGPAHA
jgi:hypothetical protein